MRCNLLGLFFLNNKGKHSCIAVWFVHFAQELRTHPAALCSGGISLNKAHVATTERNVLWDTACKIWTNYTENSKSSSSQWKDWEEKRSSDRSIYICLTITVDM